MFLLFLGCQSRGDCASMHGGRARRLARSRTRDGRPGITRERVKGRTGTRSYPKDLSVCPVADMRSGVAFSFGEVSCRIHCIEGNVVVIWRRSAAPSLGWTVSAQNISRHANAHYSPPSSDRVWDHRRHHLLPHAPHRILCSFIDRDFIQARRCPSPEGGQGAPSHVFEDGNDLA
jgi:hypothetical protein